MEYIIDIVESQFRGMEKVRYIEFVNVYLDYLNDGDAFDEMSFEEFYQSRTGKAIFQRELPTLGFIMDEIFELLDDEDDDEIGYEEFEIETERIIDKYILNDYEPEIEPFEDEYEEEIDEMVNEIEDEAIEENIEDKVDIEKEVESPEEKATEEKEEVTEENNKDNDNKGGLSVEL